jgi:lactate dehydrogenase-like 2-hydroxyacid dehydrogenase
MMKPGMMLINVSRGGLIDSDALFDGLESGQIGSLGLDVYENEGAEALDSEMQLVAACMHGSAVGPLPLINNAHVWPVALVRFPRLGSRRI